VLSWHKELLWLWVNRMPKFHTHQRSLARCYAPSNRLHTRNQCFDETATVNNWVTWRLNSRPAWRLTDTYTQTHGHRQTTGHLACQEPVRHIQRHRLRDTRLALSNTTSSWQFLLTWLPSPPLSKQRYCAARYHAVTLCVCLPTHSESNALRL